MCGIVAWYDRSGKYNYNGEVLKKMADCLVHRGPDDEGYFVEDQFALGFRRLSIIDLGGGNQPIFNEDKSIAVVCNGEIYNYQELREELIQRGHQFRTNCDVEVLVHLYEESGTDFVSRLNGQFAFVIYDRKKKQVFAVRDQVGIAPLFYTEQDGVLIMASEIKAILQHPAVAKRVNLKGLDQIMTFPGLVSPNTMFEGIYSLKPGHFILANEDKVSVHEYWDLVFPEKGTLDPNGSETHYVEKITEELERAVAYRLNADVPVGFYLSGGLDSSLIAAIIKRQQPNAHRHSFSITFAQNEINESRFQDMMLESLKSTHHRVNFNWEDIGKRLKDAIYYAEAPLKESYNTCSLALSELTNQQDIKVILTGEGADELFAGYVGYRFDRQGRPSQNGNGGLYDFEGMMEDDIRQRLWGRSDFIYEKQYYALAETRQALYANLLGEQFSQFDSTSESPIDLSKIANRDVMHVRSYLDFKLRLADHLVSDHGDRVAYANSVEARYPFLDINFIEAAKMVPPELAIKDLQEKYILKQCARPYLPKAIIDREKFSFVAPGSPFLMRNNIEWVQDMLSYDQIKRQGYFNPDTIERLKQQYTSDQFHVNQTFETDWLMIVLTFGIFLETFDMPNYAAA